MDQEDLITDITLDHLPELSDASISFQIPYNDNASTDLLADHTDTFDALCDAVDDDVSFHAPLALAHPRGPPLTLGELTPGVQLASSPSKSPTPTAQSMLFSSTKPFVVQRQLPRTLQRRHSPDKSARTPSPAKHVRWQRESPLVSSERFDQLRAELETFGRAGTIEPVGSPSDDPPTNAKAIEYDQDALDGPACDDERLAPILEEKDVCEHVVLPSDQDVVMTTNEGSHPDADATSNAVSKPPPPSKRNPRTKGRPTVADEGISKRTALTKTHVPKKSKGKPTRVREARPASPSAVRQPTPPHSIDTGRDLVPPACTIDTKPQKTQITHTSTAALADRLVSYSQKLISSIGLYKPWSENSLTEASGETGRVVDGAGVETRPPAAVAAPSLSLECIDDDSGAHRDTFRLSDISPQRSPRNHPQPCSPAHSGATVQDGSHDAVSPMKPAKKRASTDVDQAAELRRRKRGRRMVAEADSERGSSNGAVSQGERCPVKEARHMNGDLSVTHPETGEAMQCSGYAKSRMPSARTKYRPRATTSECKGPTLDAFPYLSHARQVHERREQGKRGRGKRRLKTANMSSAGSLNGLPASTREGQLGPEDGQGSGPQASVDLPSIGKKPSATLPVARLTKPIGFTFRVDARLEARKGEGRLAASEPGKATRSAHGVPEPEVRRVASSSHSVAPVISMMVVEPFIFCTERRAKEREKFEEGVKRREEEMERLREVQRQREAEEEERAIKELRRRAVPRANEVPEWYADMPKRKGTAA